MHRAKDVVASATGTALLNRALPSRQAPSVLRRIGRARTWVLVVSLAITVFAVGATAGFTYTWRSWVNTCALVMGLLALSWFYSEVRGVGGRRIAETLHEAALLIAYGPPVAALSYVVASVGFPTLDPMLAAADRSFGLDWQTWYQTVDGADPVLQAALGILYDSSLLHIGVLLVATGLCGRTDRTRELNTLLIASSLPIVLISGLMPAMSAWVHHGLGLERAYHLAHLEGLRDGSFRVLEAGNLLGIITFPSFHTAISVIVVWVSRGLPWLFWPSLVLAIGQLLSIPTEGGHYFVDMIAGAAITVTVIALMARRTSTSQAKRAGPTTWGDNTAPA